MSKDETATLAGGCFWCLDGIYRITKGVTKVTSGYAGGHVENPKYEQMHEEDTGHAEAVQIEFDPSIVSYEVLLEMFWTAHDPSQKNRDGANIGPEYRSEVFYHSNEQKEIAEKVLKNFATPLWDGKVTTEISEFTSFYPAEDYHQDYYNKNPQAGYCQVIINPKVSKVKDKFSKYLEV